MPIPRFEMSSGQPADSSGIGLSKIIPPLKLGRKATLVPRFSKCVGTRLQALAVGAILTPGQHTVMAVLRSSWAKVWDGASMMSRLSPDRRWRLRLGDQAFRAWV